MAAEIVFTPSAEDDLFAIYSFVAGRDGTARADALHRGLRGACMKLADFPSRGTPRDELAIGLRSVTFRRRATIYYRVTDAAVEIVRILYAGRDTCRQFGG